MSRIIEDESERTEMYRKTKHEESARRANLRRLQEAREVLNASTAKT